MTKQMTEKNKYHLLKIVIFASNFLCFVHIFYVVNICVCKISLFFWIVQKKYRILHLVKKYKHQSAAFEVWLRQKIILDFST